MIDVTIYPRERAIVRVRQPVAFIPSSRYLKIVERSIEQSFTIDLEDIKLIERTRLMKQLKRLKTNEIHKSQTRFLDSQKRENAHIQSNLSSNGYNSNFNSIRSDIEQPEASADRGAQNSEDAVVETEPTEKPKT